VIPVSRGEYSGILSHYRTLAEILRLGKSVKLVFVVGLKVTEQGLGRKRCNTTALRE